MHGDDVCRGKRPNDFALGKAGQGILVRAARALYSPGMLSRKGHRLKERRMGQQDRQLGAGQGRAGKGREDQLVCYSNARTFF